MKKLLFICTANLQRSPTAEKLFADCPDIETKSAGTNALHGMQVTQEIIDWADMTFVMSEAKEGHLTYLKEHFSLEGKQVHDLDIPDVYMVHSKELKQALIEKVSKYVELKTCLDILLRKIK